MAETNRPLIPMEVGLRVDVLDNDGIWNTGRIVDVNLDDEDLVEIKYDGWGDEYNEWIPLSSQRLAPLHFFTMVKKCWAKLTKWPWWPAFVVLRAPTCKAAADALNAESKIYVEFFDSYSEEKRSRCWMQKKNIASFDEGFDEKASKNIGKNFPEYVEGTQRALAGGTPVLFAGNGTLPIEFSSKYAEPLATRKLALVHRDESKWYDAYHIFSNRYRLLYGYDFAKDPAKGLVAAQGKHAKSAKAKITAKRGQEEEGMEEEDDDEVEIIEPETVKAKRGPGRPPGKQAKKQPKAVYTEEDEQEDEVDDNDDVDEYKDTGDDEDEDDQDEDDEPESPRGRRSSRAASKRKSLQSPPPTRSTRPRRAKGSR